MGARRAFKTTKKSVALGNDERECLNQETRASQVLFTQYSGIAGTTRAVLVQPAQPYGISKPNVPWIQEEELRVCNAGVHLRDQARVSNVKYFVERDRQKQQQPAQPDAVDQLTSSIAGQQQPQQQTPPPAATQQQDTMPPPTASDPTEGLPMDTGAPGTGMNQGDISMGDSDGAHTVGSSGTAEVAKET